MATSLNFRHDPPDSRSVFAHRRASRSAARFVIALGSASYADGAGARWSPARHFLVSRQHRFRAAQPVELSRPWRARGPRDQDQASSSSRCQLLAQQPSPGCAPAARPDLVAAGARRSSSRPLGDLRAQPPTGFSADGAGRLRADGRARPASLVVPRAARGARRADPPRGRGRAANAQILEIGCGTGHNLAMLGEFGDVEGLELDDEARAIAEKRLGRR